MIAVPILRSLAPWGLALTLILAVVVIDPEPARAHAAPPTEPMTPLDAWDAVRPMGLGIKIGNTLDNTTTWETGCGNPPITKQYVQALASYGFRTVRLPVAWDTYAKNGRIDAAKPARVGEIVDWITGARMI